MLEVSNNKTYFQRRTTGPKRKGLFLIHRGFYAFRLGVLRVLELEVSSVRKQVFVASNNKPARE